MARRPTFLRLAAVICLTVVAGGCGLFDRPAADRRDTPLPGTKLDVPQGDLAVTAWLPDGFVYTVWGLDLGSPHEIWRVTPGRPAERVDLPAGDGCRRTDWLLPHRLPDGRLGLARSCLSDDATKDTIDLVAFDPATRSLEVLAPLRDYNPSTVSWRRDLSAGYVSHSSGICDGFAALTRAGVQRLPAPVTLDGHTWRADELFFTPASEDCRELGNAGSALLTPDGRRLVFRAAPGAQGHSGQSRLDYPVNLYVQDLPDGRPRQLASGFADTRGMAMAPDGSRVAVAGRRGREEGVWLVDLASGGLRKVADVRFSYPSFSPDGTRLAVTFARDDDHSELRILDIPGA